MNKMLFASGVIILVGIAVMAVGTALYAGSSADLWEAAGYGTADEYVKEGKKSDAYWIVQQAGLITAGLGVGVLAIGLSMTERPPMTFRQVETHIPMPPYPPRQ